MGGVLVWPAIGYVGSGASWEVLQHRLKSATIYAVLGGLLVGNAHLLRHSKRKKMIVEGSPRKTSSIPTFASQGYQKEERECSKD